MSKVMTVVLLFLFIFGIETAYSKETKKERKGRAEGKTIQAASPQGKESDSYAKNPLGKGAVQSKSQDTSPNPTPVVSQAVPTTVSVGTTPKNELESMKEMRQEEIAECKDDAECIKSTRQRWNDLIRSHITKGKDNCKDELEALQKAEGDLKTICAKNGTPGLLECGQQIEPCSEAIQNKDRKVTITSTGAVAMSPEDVSGLAAACPAYVAEISKDWKKITENGQDKLDKLQEDSNRAKKEQQDAMLRVQDDAIRNDEQLKKNAAEQKRATTELQAAVNSVTDQLQNATQQMQMQFAREKEALNKLETAQDEAKVRFDAETGKIQTDCEEKARAQVTQFYQTMANVGSITNVINNSSDISKLGKRLESYECNKPSIIQARLNANRAYDLALRANQKNIALLKAQIDNQPRLMNGLVEKLSKIKDQNVKAAQDRLQELVDQRSTIMARMSTSSADQMMKMQLAQQRTQQLDQRVQMQNNDLAVARSSLQSAGGLSADSMEKPSARTVAGLMSSFSDLANKWCVAKLSCDAAGATSDNTDPRGRRKPANLDFMANEGSSCVDGGMSETGKDRMAERLKKSS